MSSLYIDDQKESQITISERSAFMLRTYAHLLGAVFSFIALEVLIFKSGYAAIISGALMEFWPLALGGFIIAGWLANKYAHTAESAATQYAGLALYVVTEAIFFVPMIQLAHWIGGGLLESAAMITIVGFLGLSAVAIASNRDFTYLRALLMWGGVIALLIILSAMLFGLTLGVWFSIAMIALSGVSILHDTSHVLRRYPVNQHVGAALELFASIAMLFWYVLRLLLDIALES
jgi:uncharacterized protein